MARCRSYVELPYTLPQDSTLFLLLGEDTPDIWKRKLDWVAERGGMALINVHPDYLCFDQSSNSRVYPARLYAEFLDYAKSKHGGRYWHALPRDIAKFVNANHSVFPERIALHVEVAAPVAKKIWIDLENTPHIPFFNPIMRELRARGHEVVLTARDAYQTCEMADLYGLEYERIGHHYGKNHLKKVWGLLARSSQLIPFARRERPDLVAESRFAHPEPISRILGIPTVSIMDYEHTASLSLAKSQWLINPEIVASKGEHIRHYSGIKEDVYVPDFKPDPPLQGAARPRRRSGRRDRAPSSHRSPLPQPRGRDPLRHFMDRACATPGVKSILLPRNKRQEPRSARSPRNGSRTTRPSSPRASSMA